MWFDAKVRGVFTIVGSVGVRGSSTKEVWEEKSRFYKILLKFPD